MTTPRVIAVLNELLAAEGSNLLPYLANCTTFISWASADDVDLVQGMVDEEQEHLEWLVQLILDLRGSPGPRTGAIEAGSLHYVELHTLLPRIEQAETRVLARYEAAAGAVAGEPRAAALVSRIADRHRAHLDELRRLIQRHSHDKGSVAPTQPSGSSPGR